MARLKYEHRSFDLGELGTGLHVFAENADLELTSCGALLDRFNSEIDDTEPLTAKPLGKKLNPDVGGVPVHDSDVWMYLYRGNFYVNLIRGVRGVSGPHAARLIYKSYQTGQLFWIATVQIDGCMFFSEDQVDRHIFDAVLNKRWFISDKSRKDKAVK